MIEGATESSKTAAREDIEQAIQLSIRISALLAFILNVVHEDDPHGRSSHAALLEDLLRDQARIRSRLQYLGRSL